MKHVYLLNLFSIFLIVRFVNAFNNIKHNETGRAKLMRLHCSKSEYCETHDQKVCGYNADDTYMAVFEDICALYRMNCKGHGFFAPIRIEFCRAKLKYDTEHANETFVWVHVLRNDSSSTTEAIVPNSKNQTESLPKRGIIVPNTRRSRKYKNVKRRRKDNKGETHKRSKRFQDSFLVIKRLPGAYNG